jgi:hypothetical protein
MITAEKIYEVFGITPDAMETIIEVFNQWKTADADFYGMWFGYEQFRDCSNVDIKILKKIIPELKKMGVVEYGSLFDRDGMIAGSGYILNDQYAEKKWTELLKELRG